MLIKQNLLVILCFMPLSEGWNVVVSESIRNSKNEHYQRSETKENHRDMNLADRWKNDEIMLMAIYRFGAPFNSKRSNHKRRQKKWMTSLKWTPNSSFFSFICLYWQEFWIFDKPIAGEKKCLCSFRIGFSNEDDIMTENSDLKQITKYSNCYAMNVNVSSDVN